MGNKKVVLKINADDSNASKTLKSLINKLNSFGNKIKGFANFGSTLSGVTAGFTTIKNIVGKLNAEISSISETYNTQAKAETLLSTAAKNNPYLNAESVYALKSYASELQSMSTYGDEQLLPFMAQLASAGRTQSEIMEIMGAAVDVAAGGMMSLDTAVSSLNKTFSGTVGQLGNQIAGLKDLTKEQLANGEAVKIVAESYKGMAQAVARTTGTKEQLQNAFGDLKEAIGRPFEESSRPMRQFLTEAVVGLTKFVEKITQSKHELNLLKNAFSTPVTAMTETEAQEALDTVIKDKGSTFADLKALKNAKKAVEEKADDWKAQQKEFDKLIKKYDSSISHVIGETDDDVYNALVEVLTDAIDKDTAKAEELNARLKTFEDERKEIEKEQKRIAYEKTDDYKVEQIQKAYAKSVEDAKKEIEYRRQLGETISEEEETQSVLNAMTSAYIKARKDAGALMSDENGWVKSTLSDIKTQAEKATSFFDTEAARKNFASFFPDKKTAEEEVSEYYTAQMEALQKLYDSLPEEYQKDFADDFAQAGERLATAQKEAMEKVHADERQELYSHLESSLEIVQNFIDRYSEVCSGISDIITQNAEAAATSQTLAIEKQYAAGKLSAEQYGKSLKEIEHKKAQESYRAQMWQWTANLAQATASTAQAVIQTLADATLPTAARIAMSAIIGAAGAAQLATVIGSKPIPPSFSTGGIVGGSSYYGDRISANVNSGEMILTRAQQRLLFDTINRGSMNGSMTNNVTIKNYASPDVSATVRQDGKALEVYIQKTVASQMEKGAYNRSLAIASMGMSGEKYTS